MNPKERLIKKLFANDCSREELNLLFELIQKDDSETTPEVMMTLLEQMGDVPKLDANISDSILKRIEKETIDMQEIPQRKESSLLNVNRRIWISRIAAAIALFIVSSWLIIQYSDNSELLFETKSGQQQAIVLPDGSHVHLNANSSLKFEKEWSDDEDRKVWLNGEAFFEVEKKIESGQKFKVVTKDLTVEVLGTVFNVNTHQRDTKVFLEKGKVKLNLDGLRESLMMEPGEIASYSKLTKAPVVKHLDTYSSQTSWKDGILLFDDTTLREIFERVEEIYGINIQVKDSTIYNRQISTGIPVKNLEECISILNATIADLNIKKLNDNFLIEEAIK